MAQSVKCPTHDFGSGHDLRVLRLSCVSGSALSRKSALSLFLCPQSCSHALSQINKSLKRKKEKKKKRKKEGRLGGSAVEHLPLAQSMILEFWDRVQPQAPCMEPASPIAYVSASLSLSLSLSVCVSHE